jgi:putative ATP-dependent endonuclease of OLD family
LTDANIFVGKSTLEVDLLENFSGSMTEAYQELSSSEKAQEKFENAIKKVKAGRSDSIDEIMSRIDRIGKGRFGQRLADKVKKHEPPWYIKAAIKRIVNLVNPPNA